MNDMEKRQSGQPAGQTMPARSSTTASPRATAGLDDIEKMDFEAAYKQLQHLVARLESGDTTLEGALAAFERATRLKARCTVLLDAAQKRIETLTPEEPDSGTGTASGTSGNRHATREAASPDYNDRLDGNIPY